MPRTRNIRKPAAVAPPVKAAPEDLQPSSSQLPPKGRASPVKRASSLVPFPTPPRTIHKRKRARSRVTDSEEEDEPGLELPVPDGEDRESEGKYDAQGALILGNKKRKTLDAIAEELSEAQEDAFWMGTAAPTIRGESSSKDARATRGRERERERTRSPSSSPPPAPHLLRRQHTGLASPPPSRRQPRTYVIKNVRAKRSRTTPPPVPAPTSPATRSRKPGLFPTRDSPDNPFLADDTPGVAGPSGSDRPRTPEPFVEKPTVTWVFRGKKVELINPHYRAPDAPPDPELAASLLPPEHPDYSPPPTFAPKLLFPEARRSSRNHDREVTPTPAEPRTPTRSRSLPTPGVETRAQARARARSALDSDDEAEQVLPRGKARALTAVPEEEEPVVDEAALQAAMANRLAHAHRLMRMDSSSRVSASGSGSTQVAYEPPRTRSRARAAPRLPEKDSDQARRAMGPVRTTRG